MILRRAQRRRHCGVRRGECSQRVRGGPTRVPVLFGQCGDELGRQRRCGGPQLADEVADRLVEPGMTALQRRQQRLDRVAQAPQGACGVEREAVDFQQRQQGRHGRPRRWLHRGEQLERRRAVLRRRADVSEDDRQVRHEVDAGRHLGEAAEQHESHPWRVLLREQPGHRVGPGLRFEAGHVARVQRRPADVGIGVRERVEDHRPMRHEGRGRLLSPGEVAQRVQRGRALGRPAACGLGGQGRHRAGVGGAQQPHGPCGAPAHRLGGVVEAAPQCVRGGAARRWPHQAERVRGTLAHQRIVVRQAAQQRRQACRCAVAQPVRRFPGDAGVAIAQPGDQHGDREGDVSSALARLLVELLVDSAPHGRDLRARRVQQLRKHARPELARPRRLHRAEAGSSRSTARTGLASALASLSGSAISS